MEAAAEARPEAIRGAPAHALARARAAAEADDGSGGRAAAGVRTAWAHLAAGTTEEAFLALESARSLLATR